MNWLKKNIITIILLGLMLLGVGLILYPSVADYWNSIHQSAAISRYAEAVSNIDTEEYNKMLEEARAFNQKLAESNLSMSLTDEMTQEYTELLNLGENGMMGYIEIQKINCILPIYHGVDEGILQTSVGHIPGTSLPVGGESTHTVLSGHRGLPSAKLFTDLDKMELGDIFVLRVLDEIFTYEVDQILIVEPSDVKALGIEEGMDYCTLITCTPYGVNTHRLLVRGHRIGNLDDYSQIRITADGLQIEPIIVAPMVAAPILFCLLILVLIDARKRRSRKEIRKKGSKDHEKENK